MDVANKWIDLVSSAAGNKGAFKSITSTGNYNEVLVVDETPTSDPAKWPGVFTIDHKKTCWHDAQ